MKKQFYAALLFLSVLLFGGCSGNDKKQEYQIFYLNTDVTKLISETVEVEHEDGEELAFELLEKLQMQPEDAGLRQTIPSDVSVLGVNITAYQISVDFSEEYYQMESTEEVLTRAAIAKTLLQISDYPYVVFTVAGEPLELDDSTNVGAMNEDSFLENPGGQINSSQKTTLTLYFSDKKGKRLVPEKREVHYSSNTSLEKLVMKQLIEGPKTKGLYATIPSGTKLITVTVVDKVCYVNLDEMFFNQNQAITEQTVLYSIVNSLTELDHVDKVQISINGDTSGKVRYACELATMYEANPDMMETGGEDVEVESTE